MKRLTKRNKENNAYHYPECFERCGGSGASEKCDRCDVSFNICEKLGRYEDWEEEQGLFQEIVKAIRNGAIDDLSREIKALLPAAYWKDDPEIGYKADDTTKTLFELREKIDKVAEKLKA